MDTSRRLLLLTIAALLSLALASAPALAVDEPADGEPVEAPADDGDHRIALVDTPRDRLGLVLLGAMLTAGVIAAVNSRRQLKGGRPQASGEFRWR